MLRAATPPAFKIETSAPKLAKVPSPLRCCPAPPLLCPPTGHEQLVDVLQERLVLHLGISEDEAHRLALETRNLVQALQWRQKTGNIKKQFWLRCVLTCQAHSRYRQSLCCCPDYHGRQAGRQAALLGP